VANSVEGIRIHLDGIGHLLQDSKLQVPTYQRSYAWTDKNVTQLFRDLGTAIIEGDKEYFLGSIVLIGEATDRPSVVDGQQRLATMTILLAAMRDYFEQKGDAERANKIESDYLLETDLRTQEQTPKLKLNETDNDFFYKRILTKISSPHRKEKPSKESHDRIAKAAELAAEQVNAIATTTNDPTNRLIDWLEFIGKQARVIRIQVPDDANAYRIFETLNDRGLKLALSDLVKNYLFHKADDRIGEAQKSWVAMASILEAAQDEELIVDFIRHLWSSEFGLTREKVLYDKIKERITSKQRAIDLTNKLASAAKTYAAIINTDHELWNKYGSDTKTYMATLNLMGMTQIRPLLLAILEKFTPGEIKKSMRLFVSWAVRFLVVGGLGGGPLESHYSERATDVTSGRITKASELTKAMRLVLPTDGEFQTKFATATVSKQPLARYYLRVLERQMVGETEPELVPNPNEEEINLEHILPQSLSRDWKHFDPETARSYVKRIGNLALMKKTGNNAVGNERFTDKARSYSSSELELTKAIPTFAIKGEWTKESIETRQQKLAEIAVKAWPNKGG
jgi:uncharacterized protein with ParB-like and HNH nuclease domain